MYIDVYTCLGKAEGAKKLWHGHVTGAVTANSTVSMSITLLTQCTAGHSCHRLAGVPSIGRGVQADGPSGGGLAGPVQRVLRGPLRAGV